MFTRLLQALGWVTKEEREGRRIDYGSSLCVTDIRNKSEFLMNMLDADGITYLSPTLDRNRLDNLAQAGLFSFVEKQSDSPQSS